jgi:hypothetical protein
LATPTLDDASRAIPAALVVSSVAFAERLSVHLRDLRLNLRIDTNLRTTLFLSCIRVVGHGGPYAHAAS